MRKIIFMGLIAAYFVCNWLVDLWSNIGVNTTCGMWSNLFNLDRSTSHHIAWYCSMLIFMIMAYNVKVRK